MKKTSALLFALFTFAAVETHAQELYEPQQFAEPSTLTRAQVKAETMRALKAGEISFGDVDRPATVSRSSLTRAEVKQELARAQAAHEVHYGDVDPEPVYASAGTGRTRAEVRAEMLAGKAHPNKALEELYRN